MLTCPSCQQEYQQDARFCQRCGVRLVRRDTAADEARSKPVTVLSCGLDGSTPRGARLALDTYQALLGRYRRQSREVLEQHGGTVEELAGDAVVAAFGIPAVHEDDALRAATAATRLQAELHRLDRELERDHGAHLSWRIGVATGEALVRATGEPSTMLGGVLAAAGRLQQAAGAREILVSGETYQLVRKAVLAHPVEVTSTGSAWRLDVADPDARDKGRHARTPLVGRDGDLELLAVALKRATTQRRCHLVTVVGDAGIGKSRLVDAFAGSTGARVLRGTCRAYGRDTGYRPVLELVRRAAGVEPEHGLDAMAARLVELVGNHRVALAVAKLLVGSEEAARDPEDARWTLLRFFEALSRRRGLVLVVDDLQWADAELIELLGHLAEWSRDAPILLVCVGRPEFWIELLERGGRLDAIQLRLPPLGTRDAEELVRKVLRQGQVPPGLPARIAEVAAGYPLFVEALIGMLLDDGSLRLVDGRWEVMDGLEELRLPPSLHALLAARLDELPATERRMLGRAAVMRWQFPVAALAALSPELTEHEVRASVLSLARKELLRPGHILADPLPGADRFTFRLALLRDAAYRSIPERARAELHQRYADWIERQALDRPAEVAEMVGYHLNAAHRLWTEQGRSDELTEDLARRAGEWLWRHSH